MTDTPVPEEREPNPAEQTATPEPPAAAEAEPPTAEPAATPEGEAQPAPEQPAPEQPAQRPQRPRRRRLTAAERHRRTFFAKLGELRRQEQAALAGGPEPEDQPAAEGEAAPAAAEGEAPQEAAEEPQAQQQQQQQPQAPATSPSRSARAQARLVAAIDRVGGPEAVREALQPKRREDGETMKWSSVCAEQAHGHKPGDPVFTAWVRLAATPVRDVKAIVNPRNRDDDRRGGRGRGRRRDGGGGGGYRGGGYDGERGGGRGARREDIESHGRDGSFRSSVRIVMVDADGSRKEPEDAQEAAERLARSRSSS